jgi:hypothetical protein
MELVLTLASIAGFFALVLTWVVLPSTSAAQTESAPAGAPSPQAAH